MEEESEDKEEDKDNGRESSFFCGGRELEKKGKGAYIDVTIS